MISFSQPRPATGRGTLKPSLVATASLLAVCAFAHASDGKSSAPDARIPAVHGTALSGDPVTLPESLHGRVAVLVVGFSQSSRDQATAWGRRIAVDYLHSPAVTYYELPVLESVPRLLRGFVLHKISESVSAAARPHFLPVFDHESDWKSLAGFSKNDDAYLLLVDSTGQVRWKTEGPLTEEAYANLRRHIDASDAP